MANSDCPVCRTADIVCGKWTLLVIRDLAEQRARFCGRSRRRGSSRARRSPRCRRASSTRSPPRAARSCRSSSRCAATAPSGSGPTDRAPRRPSRSPSSHSTRVGLQARLRAEGCPRGLLNSRRMHNRALHDTLAAFVEEAASQLAEEVAGGAEIPFELVDASASARGSAPLYCYRPLTQRFLAERAGALGRLPSYAAAVQGMTALPQLQEYLRARGRRPPGSDARAQADAALQAFIGAMW